MKIRRFAFGICLACALILPVLLLARYFSIRSECTLILENRSSETIDHALVTVSGQDLKFERIEPGGMKREQFQVGRDSDYQILIKFSSGRTMESEAGYVTTGMDVEDRIVVGDSTVVIKRERVVMHELF